MKKIIMITLLVCIALTTLLPTFAYAKPGDVLGYAKYTDISAYINHYPITSYNINGYTVVVAEDLRNYGFDVTWNQYSRSLYIKRSSAKSITPYGTIYKYESKLGQNSMPYLETDIRTYVNGSLVGSYNIDGKTVINIEDLRPYGEVVWVPEIRAIKMWITDLPQATYKELTDISAVGKTTTTSSQNMYYPGTIVPDYTYVTGVPQEQSPYYGDSGYVTYIYSHTKEGEYYEIVDYMGVLRDNGWKEYDEEEESDNISWYFVKDRKMIGVTCHFEFDQVWISFKAY